MDPSAPAFIPAVPHTTTSSSSSKSSAAAEFFNKAVNNNITVRAPNSGHTTMESPPTLSTNTNAGDNTNDASPDESTTTMVDYDHTMLPKLLAKTTRLHDELDNIKLALRCMIQREKDILAAAASSYEQLRRLQAHITQNAQVEVSPAEEREKLRETIALLEGQI